MKKPMFDFEKNRSADVLVRSSDLWTLLLCSIRYCLGRRTYMPILVQEVFKKHSTALAVHELVQARKEVLEEIEIAVRRNTLVGAQYDHDAWVEFVDHVQVLIDARQETPEPAGRLPVLLPVDDGGLNEHGIDDECEQLTLFEKLGRA